MSELVLDARADAERYASDLKRWASYGFLRGLAGWRNEVVPQGQTRMPSEAFHEFAAKVIAAEDCEPETRRIREAYLSEVEERLADLQREAVDEHNRLATLGGLADIGLSIASVLAVFVMIQTLGAFHPAVFAVLATVAVTFFGLSACARRTIRLGMAVFQSDDRQFDVPWTAQR